MAETPVVAAATPNDSELPEETFEDQDEELRSELQVAPKDRKLVTHPYDFIIRSLTTQVDDGTLILGDQFQRRRVWDEWKASGLIESLLLNVPIPVCYFAELENGSYSVIDGQQRLTAIYRFIKNDFPLKGLRVRPELNKFRFNQLTPEDKRVINSRTLRCIVILKESHPDIRFDVFERLNTNSVRLNPQELRNSVYRGPLNSLLHELCQNELFLATRNVKEIDKRMKDCELILRFFAFHYSLGQYKGYLASFLDDYLRSGMRFDTNQIDIHRSLFIKTIADVHAVFGRNAFRRHTETGWERQVNRAVYDVIMLSFALLDSALIRRRAANIIDALQRLSSESEFIAAITYGTQGVTPVDTRLNKWRAALVAAGIDIPRFVVGSSS